MTVLEKLKNRGGIELTNKKAIATLQDLITEAQSHDPEPVFLNDIEVLRYAIAVLHDLDLKKLVYKEA